MEKVSDKIYMIQEAGSGNIGVYIGKNGVFMIDDQFADHSEQITALIKTVTDKPISFILNTHWHGDHTGGNKVMNTEDVIVIAHENVRKRMSTEQFNKAWNRTTPPSPSAALPEITFTEDMTFYLDEEPIMIFHIHNAHTDGDALVYFPESNVLHMGDTYFQGKYPFIDLSSNGSVHGYVKAVKKGLLLSDEQTKIIPGHLNISNKKELSDYLIMLEEIRDKVAEQIAEGKTLEEVKAATEITKTYDDLGYGDWFINATFMRQTFYESLKQ